MDSSKKRIASTDAPSKKRLKARVGKRAIQPANVTDTSFRAASVATRAQAVDRNGASNGDLQSKRGKSVEELTAQLHHNATTARLSAIKGLANAIEYSSPSSLQASLATLIPAVSKSCLDEDGDVRTAGLAVVHDLLKKILEANPIDVLRPFVPLLTAYATSALTSLDRSTRLDGARFVQILCNNISNLMKKEVLQILPPYVGLLSDHINKQTSRLVCLRSLASLLKIRADMEGAKLQHSSKDYQNSNTVFTLGGKSSNAIFVSGLGSRRRHVRPFASIQDLPSIGSINNSGQTLQTTSKAGTEQQINVSTTCDDLAKKIYNVVVELSERQKSNLLDGFYLELSDVEELSQLVSLMRYFLDSFGCNLLLQPADVPEIQKFRQTCTSLLGLLLNSFPVLCTGSKKDPYNIVNSSMCHLLIDLGSSLESSSKTPSWINKVLDYTLSNLDFDEKASGSRNDSSAIDITAKLLLLRHDGVNFVLDNKTRQTLLEKIHEAYFASQAVLLQGASSDSGQKAASLVCNLLASLDYNADKSNLLLREMVPKLPLFLCAWDVDIPSQTSAVLKSLINVVRRCSTSVKDEIVDGLQSNLGNLFASGRKTRAVSEKTREKSLFERYPEPIQRQVVALVGMLESPSADTIEGLSRFCSRSLASSDTDAQGFALHVLHTIRRSMSMQAYLGFVIGITGIGKRPNREAVSAKESCLRSSCRALERSGGMKTLPMLVPVLSMWFERAYGEDSKSTAKERFAGAVTVASIVAMLFLGSKSCTATADGSSSEFLDVLSSLKKPLSLALHDILSAATTDVDVGNETADDDLRRHLKPLIALVESAPQLLPLICEHGGHQICKSKSEDGDLDGDRKTEIRQSLYLMINSLDELFSSGSGDIPRSLVNAFKELQAVIDH